MTLKALGVRSVSLVLRLGAAVAQLVGVSVSDGGDAGTKCATEGDKDATSSSKDTDASEIDRAITARRNKLREARDKYI